MVSILMSVNLVGLLHLREHCFAAGSFGCSKPRGSTIKVAIVLTGGNVSRSTIDQIVNHKAE